MNGEVNSTEKQDRSKRPWLVWLISSQQGVAMDHKFPTREQIDRMTTEQKIQGLRSLAVLTEEAYRIAALYWASLEFNGDDLTALVDENPGFFRRVRDIAHSRLSAKAYCTFRMNPVALRVVSKLPVDAQEKLAVEPYTELVTRDATTGSLTQRKVAVAEMTSSQVKLAFNPSTGERRTFNEQVAILTMPPSISDREPAVVSGRIYIRGNKFWTDGKTTLDQVAREMQKHGWKLTRGAN